MKKDVDVAKVQIREAQQKFDELVRRRSEIQRVRDLVATKVNQALLIRLNIRINQLDDEISEAHAELTGWNEVLAVLMRMK